MKVIDAQIHLWGRETPGRPWPAAIRAHDPLPWSADRALREMEAAGVDGAIIVPPNWDGDSNDVALAAVGDHPARFAIMGKIDTDRAPDPSRLAGWKDQRGMVGLRFNLHGKAGQHFLDGKLDWVWSAAEAHGIPVAVLVPDVLAHLGKVAGRHPRLKIAIDHMATALASKDDAAFVHLPELLALARHPNISVKVSGLVTNTSDPYPFNNLHDRIRAVYDRFGPERMFWGSDLSRLTVPYRQAVTLFTEELPWLTASDKELIMGGAIAGWLGLPG